MYATTILSVEHHVDGLQDHVDNISVKERVRMHMVRKVATLHLVRQRANVQIANCRRLRPACVLSLSEAHVMKVDAQLCNLAGVHTLAVIIGIDCWGPSTMTAGNSIARPRK